MNPTPPIRIVALAAVLAIPMVASADIITGVKARASSEFNGRPAMAAVNGRGLGPDDTHTGGGGSTADMWLSASGDTNATFVVDLGAVYLLDSAQVWNYNELANATCCLSRGVATGTLDSATTFGSYTPVGPVAFAIAPGTQTNFSETFPLGGLSTRYLRLNIGSNHGDGSFSGLSEIRFDGSLAPGQNLPLLVLGATASTQFAGREAVNAVNGNGLFGPTHSIVPTGNMWLGTIGDLTGSITFDLGSSQALGSMKLWNYNETLAGREAELLSRGINEASILVSDDNVTFTEVLTRQFMIAPGNNLVDFSETVALNATGRYVRLDILSNHGNLEYTGLSEVQFFVSTTDTDGDALPDAWEELYFPGDLTQLTGLKTGPGPGADSGDFDGDGLSDFDENRLGTLPNDTDTDDDMLTDGAEVAGDPPRPATNPRSPDTDGDTLTDFVETNTGIFVNADNTGTDPTKRDSDSDTFADNIEIEMGTDPNDNTKFPLATLVGYWPFDGDIDPQPDLSEFGNDAVVNGAGTWANDVLRESGVMRFVSGVGLQAAHSESLNITGAITIAAWVKPTAGAWEGIVAKSPAGTLQNYPGNYELRIHTTGRHLEMLWEPAPEALAAVNDTGNGVPDNAWTHVAFAGTPGGSYTFYVNGVATGTGAMPDNFTGQNTNPLYIGSRADAFTGFDGCLDDVAIFDGQLPPQQISEIMDGNFSAFGLGGNDFRITGIVFDRAAPSVTFTFNSRPGQHYIIEASTHLNEREAPGGWFELDDSFLSQGAETTYVDTFAVAAPNLTQIFYRVKKAP